MISQSKDGCQLQPTFAADDPLLLTIIALDGATETKTCTLDEAPGLLSDAHERGCLAEFCICPVRLGIGVLDARCYYAHFTDTPLEDVQEKIALDDVPTPTAIISPDGIKGHEHIVVWKLTDLIDVGRGWQPGQKKIAEQFGSARFSRPQTTLPVPGFGACVVHSINDAILLPADWPTLSVTPRQGGASRGKPTAAELAAEKKAKKEADKARVVAAEEAKAEGDAQPLDPTTDPNNTLPFRNLTPGELAGRFALGGAPGGGSQLVCGGSVPIVHRHRAQWKRYDKTIGDTKVVSDEEMKTEFHDFLNGKRYWSLDQGVRKLERIVPCQSLVAEGVCAFMALNTSKMFTLSPDDLKIANAFTHRVMIPSDRTPPLWLIDPAPFGLTEDSAGELIGFRNGVLHAPGWRFFRNKPKLDIRALVFGLRCLDIEMPLDESGKPKVGEPKCLLGFLDSLKLDAESTQLIQEWLGLLLTAITKYHKALGLIGPMRSGKGVLAYIATLLVGRLNMAAPTLSSLGESHGLEDLDGKLLGIIADARTGGHKSVETLLGSIGEDEQRINPKGRTAYNAKLNARFMVMSNVNFRLPDASAAVASRFLMLKLTESFLGREDITLKDRLKAELPEILYWAAKGLKRLTERGHFIQPASSLDLVRDLEGLSSPTLSFARDRCIVEDAATVPKADLYGEWQAWNESQGASKYTGTQSSFARDLRAAVPTIGEARPYKEKPTGMSDGLWNQEKAKRRREGKTVPRVHSWTGIRLKTHAELEACDD